jgi:hypothetical protein
VRGVVGPDADFAVTGTAIGTAETPAFVAAAIAAAAVLTDSTLPVTMGTFSTLAGAGAEYNSILLATFEVTGMTGVADSEAAGTGRVTGTAGTAAPAGVTEAKPLLIDAVMSLEVAVTAFSTGVTVAVTTLEGKDTGSVGTAGTPAFAGTNGAADEESPIVSGTLDITGTVPGKMTDGIDGAGVVIAAGVVITGRVTVGDTVADAVEGTLALDEALDVPVVGRTGAENPSILP